MTVVNDDAIRAAFDMLGHQIKDKVSGEVGIANCVSFDLYGCVQVSMDRGFNEKRERLEGFWFDATRLEKVSKKRVMEPPDFLGTVRPLNTTAAPGPAEKPSR